MQFWNRRRFIGRAIQGAALASVAGKTRWASAEQAGQGTIMFAGTQTGASNKSTSEGIHAFRWDAKAGALTPLGLAVKSANPTFLALAPGGKFLIAANETDDFDGPTQDEPVGFKTGGVSSFAVDGAHLTLVNTVAAEGAGTCHVSVDHTGGAVFAANYTGGSAAAFHLGSEGRLSQAVSHFKYEGHGPVADRQEAAHAHRTTVSPENQFVFINDLGLDCIHIYRLDPVTAKLTPASPPEWKAAPGSGPRALRFHPSGRWAYCVNELSSTIDVLGWDPSVGRFSGVQKLDLLPAGAKGANRASEIVFDRSGQFAYAAVRDANFLATLAVHESTGKLTLMDRGNCGGKTPRHIALDPTERWLLVANQDSDLVSVFSRDAKTGKLDGTAIQTSLSKPQCLLFAWES